MGAEHTDRHSRASIEQDQFTWKGQDCWKLEEEGIQKTTENKDCGKEDEDSISSNHNALDKEHRKLVMFWPNPKETLRLK